MISPLQICVAACALLLAAAVSAEPQAQQRITIAAVGDMMLGTDYPTNRLSADDGASYLAAVAPWLRAADITFGNLEGVLADSGEPGKKCSNPAACYRFRMPERYSEHFKNAGFDVLSVANNHARDFGEEGRSNTMRVLSDTGIHYSGRVGNFASFEHDGLRIAVLAYAVTRNSNMMLDYLFAERTVARYANTHDIVVVSFHGGAEGSQFTHVTFAEEEYYGEPRGDVVRFARMVVDAGADLVLGHGPHVVRAMERYKDRLIAYSLGNFATNLGISVEGIKGVAPILLSTLDHEGRFIEGEIISTVQTRGKGPAPDPEARALRLLRSLSNDDFKTPGLNFRDDGRLLPVERPPVMVRTDFGPDDDAGENGPAACKENWFWLVESTVKAADEITLGADIETPAWQRAVEQRLGLEEQPALDLPAWCEYIDSQLRPTA